MNTCFYWFLLSLLVLLGLCGPSLAITPPAGRLLAEALNSDGTLKAGAAGSFDARQFRMDTAPDGRPVFRPAGTAGAGDERWQSGFGLNGTNNEVAVVVLAGANIYIGGSFTVVGNITANHVARWDGSAWRSLGTGAANGVDGSVLALVVAGNGDVYVGGQFSYAGGLTVNRIARWNGTGWRPVGTGPAFGMAGSVHALAIASNGDVYAGGQFAQIDGVLANGVARWDGTSWYPLGSGAMDGVNGIVQALVVAGNGDVYVGGTFTFAGGVAANRVARWNGTVWSSLGTGAANGVSNYVWALAVAGNGDVYVGGTFERAGGGVVNRVARWDGTAWNPLNTGNNIGVNATVRTLAVAGNGNLYVGGQFSQAGGGAAKLIARWNGAVWSSLGTGTANGLIGLDGSSTVSGLAIASNGDVYAGGNFRQAGGVPIYTLAKWNSTIWSSLILEPTNGLNGSVSALALAGNGDVYVGGGFTLAGNLAANRVAKWNGTSWSSLGTGAANGVDGSVSTLAVAGNGDVYVGGIFTQAGGVLANNVAKWNGTAWSSLGTGAANGVNNTNGINSNIAALAVSSNGDVYVGGNFMQAGGVPANSVARWNGTTWSSLGTGAVNGVDGYVHALAVAGNGDVYAGGYFRRAGNMAANWVARWNGTVWSSLGVGAANGVGDAVNALAVDTNGNVYVGGNFVQAGAIPAGRVAKWNGTVWSPLGTSNGVFVPGVNGISSSVGALAVAANGNLYACGNFPNAGGVSVNSVAKWNGTTWSSLGTGLNESTGGAIALGRTGKVYVGGGFETTGDGSKVMVRFGIYDPNAPLATSAAARAAPAAQLFPNPAHGTATLRLPAGAPRLPLTLTDALGRVVRCYPAPTTAEAVLDLRGLPAGVYVVGCGQVTQRLVVE